MENHSNGFVKLSMFFLAAIILILPSCANLLPGLAQVADELTNDAVSVTVTKEAMKKNTDVKVCVEVINNETK